MEGFPVAALLSQSVQERTTRSALPDAPVVPDRPDRHRRPDPDRPDLRGPRAARSRTALARVLARAAEAVAPAPSTPSPRC